MKKLACALLAASALLSATLPSYAACPAGTTYRCYPSSGGKMACGCY